MRPTSRIDEPGSHRVPADGTLSVMPLEKYQRKRDFAKTPEPAGVPSPAATSGRFVVQRHRATRLHYDFRLEIGGVLVSWAVPRGPTLDPSQRRMAMHVEDHPIEYLDFEGVIPPKQYGAGDVIVWDWGTWEPEAETPDPERAIRDGELKFRLHGQKLAGRYTIVQTSGRPGKAERQRIRRAAAARETNETNAPAGAPENASMSALEMAPETAPPPAPDHTPTRAGEADQGGQWLLIKKRDEAAQDGWDPEDHPQSVKTGRTNDEVKANADALWISEAPAASAEIDLSAAEPARPGEPRFIEPMLATLSDRPFDDEDWLFEVKWDGYRVQAIVWEGRSRIYTRNGHDAATYFPTLLPAPRTWIHAETAVLDGEVVALDEEGRPDFGLLQARIPQATRGRVPGQWGSGGRRGRSPEGGDTETSDADDAAARAPLVYQVFDLLQLDGRSLLRVPLMDRKRLLRSILTEGNRVRFAAHIEREGMAFYRAAAARGLEGVVAKHRRSRYEPGRRSTAWLKLKLRPEQALIVGGWTPGEGNAKELGALIVGVRDGEGGPLRFAGKVGSGFDARGRRLLRERLDALASETCPFDPEPAPRPDLRGARWIEPSLVIRAELGGWSRDGLVRQSAFKGIDDGRDPASVVRESPVASAAAHDEAEAAIGPDPRLGRPDAGARSGAPPAGALVPPLDPALAPAPARHAPGAAGAVGSRRRGATAPSEVPPEWEAATEAELEALARLGKQGSWRVGEIELKLTNLDKVIFPGRGVEGGSPGEAAGEARGEAPGEAIDEMPSEAPAEALVTKRDLIGYFARIAPAMLPHLAERPLNLQRFPDGADKPGFWQKDLRSTDPGWLRRWREPGAGSSWRSEGARPRDANTHLVDRTAALCWLCNEAAFEIHAWTSRLTAPDRPTFALIDIDPGERTTWDETLVLARLFRTALEHLGVRGYPQNDRQAWHPGAGGSPSSPATATTRRAPGWRTCRGRSARSCPTSSAGSGRRTAVTVAPASTTPRTRTSRRSSRRTPFDPRPAPRYRRRSPGTSSTTRPSAQTVGRSGHCRPAWPRSATRSRAPRPISRCCRRSGRGTVRLRQYDRQYGGSSPGEDREVADVECEQAPAKHVGRRGEQVVGEVDARVGWLVAARVLAGHIRDLRGHGDPVDQPEEGLGLSLLTWSQAGEYLGTGRGRRDQLASPVSDPAERIERRAAPPKGIDEHVRIYNDWRHRDRSLSGSGIGSPLIAAILYPSPGPRSSFRYAARSSPGSSCPCPERLVQGRLELLVGDATAEVRLADRLTDEVRARLPALLRQAIERLGLVLA